jgi:hypothetical protein
VELGVAVGKEAEVAVGGIAVGGMAVDRGVLVTTRYVIAAVGVAPLGAAVAVGCATGWQEVKTSARRMIKTGNCFSFIFILSSYYYSLKYHSFIIAILVSKIFCFFVLDTERMFVYYYSTNER